MHINKTVVSDKGVRGGLTVPGKTRILGSEHNAEFTEETFAARRRCGSVQPFGSNARNRQQPLDRLHPSATLFPQATGEPGAGAPRRSRASLPAVPEHPSLLLGTAGLPPHLPRGHARLQLRPSVLILSQAPLMPPKLIRAS